MKHPADTLGSQIPYCQPYAPYAKRDVVPSHAESLPAHEPGRDEDAKRHRHQQQRTED